MFNHGFNVKAISKVTEIISLEQIERMKTEIELNSLKLPKFVRQIPPSLF